jgi:hypothetical protein
LSLVLLLILREPGTQPLQGSTEKAQGKRDRGHIEVFLKPAFTDSFPV